ncbi:uncharacterized protein LOC110705163 isoform X2 [Chenopodium quinoa]|uniref:uncharacterized protein LOC110705163 isoform X2 n=1 Tax=Chenopodium quinoa TaxID=63459 RepID=UPI000B7948EB|nr:uncharacterized protein LOC110705163 isoform X2 [Chenopodium quinoa]
MLRMKSSLLLHTRTVYWKILRVRPYVNRTSSHLESVYIVYTVLGDIHIYLVGKDEYDELALSEVIFIITSTLKDVCGKPPNERMFLDKYGRICLCLDEIVWTGVLENTDKERIKRLVRLKPPTEF